VCVGLCVSECLCVCVCVCVCVLMQCDQGVEMLDVTQASFVLSMNSRIHAHTHTAHARTHTNIHLDTH
jgi:preprotein translocase subunit SecG